MLAIIAGIPLGLGIATVYLISKDHEPMWTVFVLTFVVTPIAFLTSCYYGPILAKRQNARRQKSALDPDGCFPSSYWIFMVFVLQPGVYLAVTVAGCSLIQ